MLAFAFGENGGIMDTECLEYKGQAIKFIGEKIKSPGIAMTDSMIGAILLLVGVEVRITVYIGRELSLTSILAVGPTRKAFAGTDPYVSAMAVAHGIQIQPSTS